MNFIMDYKSSNQAKKKLPAGIRREFVYNLEILEINSFQLLLGSMLEGARR